MQLENEVSILKKKNTSPNIFLIECHLGYDSKYYLKFTLNKRDYKLFSKENDEYLTDDFEEMKGLAAEDVGLQRIIPVITNEIE